MSNVIPSRRLRRSVSVVCLSLLAVTAVSVEPRAAGVPRHPAETTRVTAVPWRGDPTQAREVFPGGALVLQAVATVGDDETPTLVSASWDPGDGSGPIAVDATNPRALELTHVYTGAPGQRYTATITVTDDLGQVASDAFEVVVRAKTLQVEVAMAIDRGLWFLHKRLTRDGSGATGTATFVGGAYDTASIAGAVQAMAINNHRPSGDPFEDPYVLDVRRMLRGLETRLAPITIGPKLVGNPDSNGNGIGVYPLESPTNYILGHIMTAMIAAGVPDQIALVGPNGVQGRSYRDLVQDMADYYASSQMDANQAFPHRGSWSYSPYPGHADTSVSQWAAAGLHLAERFWGIPVPPFVKSENRQSVNGLSAMAGPGRVQFGYLSSAPLWGALATTPAGAMQLLMTGERFSTGGGSHLWLEMTMRWIAWYQRTTNNYKCCAGWSIGNEMYAWYSTARVYRLMLNPAGQAAPVTLVDDDPADGVPAWDWFWNDPPAGASATAGPIGMARAFVADQAAEGSWRYTAGIVPRDLATAYGIVILSPAHVTPPPAAVCTVTPTLAGVGDPVTFSAAQSNHPDPARQVVRYDWDFGDGTTGTGALVSHTYAAAGSLPHSFITTLTVTDDLGASSQTTCTSVQDVLNEPPVATDNAYTTDEDLAVSGNVLTDGTPDSDPEALGLTAELVTNPSAGTVTLSPDGHFVYVPATDFHGTDTFVYQAVDVEGGTATATVTIAIAPINDAPIAVDDVYDTTEDMAVSGNVLSDGTPDRDVDGDPLTAALATAPSHGTVSLNADGTFGYAPTADFHGADSFTYRVSDVSGATALAKVTITIAPVNDAPIAVDDVYAAIEGGTISGNVLLDDTDIDGDTLTAAVTSGPTYGALSVNADGTFTYTAGIGFTGADTFVYRADDGHGGSAAATVTINIAVRNQPPVCVAARPSIALLWPANGRMVSVNILGVTDDDASDVVTIRIDDIRQDEPTNTQGDGNTPIDGDGVGSSTAQVRAERSGTARVPGNGRVYHISFTATDTAGASCAGVVQVGVPHDRGQRAVPVDDGPRYPSTFIRSPGMS